MSADVTALRGAIQSFVAGNAPLAGRLGAQLIHEDMPRNAVLPYAAFGETRVRNVPHGGGQAREHLIDLHVWCEPSSSAGLAIAEHLAAALDDAVLVPAGFQPVRPEFIAIETRRENNGRIMKSTVRLRAFVECL